MERLEDIGEPKQIPKLTIIDKNGDVKLNCARKFSEAEGEVSEQANALMMEIS